MFYCSVRKKLKRAASFCGMTERIMVNEVYTRNDLHNLYLARLAEVRNRHIEGAVQFIKNRVLNSASLGIECTVFRRISPFQHEWQNFGTRAILKANGLLDNDMVEQGCVEDVVTRLHSMFPDSHIMIQDNGTVIYIGWLHEHM